MTKFRYRNSKGVAMVITAENQDKSKEILKGILKDIDIEKEKKQDWELVNS